MVKRPKHTADQPGNGFKRLGIRLAKTTRRSAFSIWLAQGDHYERLTAEISKHGVRWDEIARWAEYEGHTGGKPITGLAAKRAYERETDRREKAAKASSVTSVKPTQPARAINPVRIMPQPEPPQPPQGAPQDVGDNQDRFADLRKKMAASQPWNDPKGKA